MLAHSAEARSACAESAEALTESKEVKSKIPKGCCTLSQPACIVHPWPRKHASAHIAKSLRLCRPKSRAKAHTNAQSLAAAARTLVPKGAQTPTKAPE